MVEAQLKINKVIFSCSEPQEYSSFWNKQSEIWSKGIGIEPVCLLFGKKANTDMNENYGKIIEMEFIPDLPQMIQLTWSKFVHPATEPDTTWIMGDIDMIPLQKAYFTSNIAQYSDDSYLNLNVNGCGPYFIDRGPGKGGTSLPGHYHVAKGKLFSQYIGTRCFADQIREITLTHRYGMGPAANKPRSEATTDPYWYYWLAEEMYSSEVLWNNMRNGSIKFHGISYNNGNNHQRIDRSCYSNDRKDYTYSEDKLRQKQFVDIHCIRPYQRNLPALDKIIELSGILA